MCVYIYIYKLNHVQMDLPTSHYAKVENGFIIPCPFQHVISVNRDFFFLPKSVLLGSMIMLLLLISGNAELNPSPQDVISSYPALADFKTRSGLGFVHLNV